MPQLDPESGPFSGLYDTGTQGLQVLNYYVEDAKQWLAKQPAWKRISIYIIVSFFGVFCFLVLIFHKKLIKFLIDSSTSWHDSKHGKFVMFTLIFFVSFPPLIGFSALSTLTGMIWGFPYGWPLLASASITGSVCSFFLFRFLFLNKARQLINKNKNFAALSEVMKEDKRLVLLILVRLCPLPYSLSNGALAAIPDVTLTRFFLASLITSPKLLIHTFVGSKLKEMGETDDSSTRLVDLASIIIAMIAASATAYIIYFKMKEKLDHYHNFLDDDYDQDNSMDPELVTLGSSFDSDHDSIDDFVIDGDFNNDPTWADANDLGSGRR